MLVDRYGRFVTGLRVSITDKCNLSCFYCHREWNAGSGRLGAKDILEVAKAARELGIRRLRLTGGEPTLNDELAEIVREVSPLFEEVSMTTNGITLKDMAKELKDRGLRRVNVSLPTLSSEKYVKITGKDVLEEVLQGIARARDVGLRPVKLNFVVLRGVNENEVEEMLRFAATSDLELQLIELQPIPDGAEVFQRFYVDLGQIEERLARISSRVVKDAGRTSFTLSLNGREVEVTTVRPHANSDFCRYCSRLRVSADMKLKPCLLRNDNTIDLRGAHDSESLKELFLKAVSLREPYWK